MILDIGKCVPYALSGKWRWNLFENEILMRYNSKKQETSSHNVDSLVVCVQMNMRSKVFENWRQLNTSLWKRIQLVLVQQ